MVTQIITDNERRVLLESLKDELEVWWASHHEMRNYATIGRRAGVSAETTRRVFQGIQLPSPSTARKLGTFIESPTLKICGKTKFSKSVSRKTQAGKGSKRRQVGGKEVRKEAGERIAKVEELLIELANVIEFFKNGSPSERKLLKNLLNPSDVGYITSLLRAFFDEDVFQKWILLSEYEMRGGKS